MVLIILGRLIGILAGLYMVVLFARMILSWVQFFSPTWRPSGIVLIVANLINALTDTPLRFLARRIPPLTLGGGIALDVGFLLLFVAVLMIERLGAWLATLGYLSL